MKMLRKSGKEKLYGVEAYRVNTKYSYKNILLNANLSKILNVAGVNLPYLKARVSEP